MAHRNRRIQELTNRLAFMDVLSQRGIVIFDYDESMLASELKGIAQLSLNQHGRQ
jgi:predicted HTH domain antitoxin